MFSHMTNEDLRILYDIFLLNSIFFKKKLKFSREKGNFFLVHFAHKQNYLRHLK